jgi:hypothetical protein
MFPWRIWTLLSPSHSQFNQTWFISSVLSAAWNIPRPPKENTTFRVASPPPPTPKFQRYVSITAKVRFFLDIISRLTPWKKYGGGMTPRILKFGISWMWMVSFVLQIIFTTCTLRVARWVDFRTCLEISGIREIFFFCPESNPESVGVKPRSLVIATSDVFRFLPKKFLFKYVASFSISGGSCETRYNGIGSCCNTRYNGTGSCRRQRQCTEARYLTNGFESLYAFAYKFSLETDDIIQEKQGTMTYWIFLQIKSHFLRNGDTKRFPRPNRQSPVEMWGHTVTHGRGSEGETGEWSG